MDEYKTGMINAHLSLMRDAQEDIGFARRTQDDVAAAEDAMRDASSKVYSEIKTAVDEGFVVFVHRRGGEAEHIVQIGGFDANMHSFLYSPSTTVAPYRICNLQIADNVEISEP